MKTCAWFCAWPGAGTVPGGRWTPVWSQRWCRWSPRRGEGCWWLGRWCQRHIPAVPWGGSGPASWDGTPARYCTYAQATEESAAITALQTYCALTDRWHVTEQYAPHSIYLFRLAMLFLATYLAKASCKSEDIKMSHGGRRMEVTEQRPHWMKGYDKNTQRKWLGHQWFPETDVLKARSQGLISGAATTSRFLTRRS